MSLFNKKHYDSEQATVDASARTLTTAKVDNSANYPDFKASGVLIQPTVAIYYTMDGSTPSSTNGIELAASQFNEILGYQNVKKLKWIRTSSSGVMNVQYFKE